MSSSGLYTPSLGGGALLRATRGENARKEIDENPCNIYSVLVLFSLSHHLIKLINYCLIFGVFINTLFLYNSVV
jgi:hypothetical protein